MERPSPWVQAFWRRDECRLKQKGAYYHHSWSPYLNIPEVCEGGLKAVLKTAPGYQASPGSLSESFQLSVHRCSAPHSTEQGRLARLSLLRPHSDFHRPHTRGLQRARFMLEREGLYKNYRLLLRTSLSLFFFLPYFSHPHLNFCECCLRWRCGFA